jgi:pyridoxine 4-dehydrogenase
LITLGNTPIRRMGLGTNRLTNTPENVEFIQRAVASGIGMIDTAHVYRDGDSERTIGAALSGEPEGCIVATKGGYDEGDARPEILREQIEQSLRSLQTERIGLYYLHKPDRDTPIEESVGAIAEHVDTGRIRYVGLSNVSVEQIERARQVTPIAAVQNHYSMAEREHDDVLEHCEANGIAFVAYFPLRGVDAPPGEALRWLLDRSPAVLPIPGTLSPEHLRENLAALE